MTKNRGPRDTKWYQMPADAKQTCTVEGPRAQVEKCLELIREQFPEDKYPDLSLEEVGPRTLTPAQRALAESASPGDGFAQKHLHEVIISYFRNAGKAAGRHGRCCLLFGSVFSGI